MGRQNEIELKNAEPTSMYGRCEVCRERKSTVVLSIERVHEHHFCDACFGRLKDVVNGGLAGQAETFMCGMPTKDGGISIAPTTIDDLARGGDVSVFSLGDRASSILHVGAKVVWYVWRRSEDLKGRTKWVPQDLDELVEKVERYRKTTGVGELRKEYRK